MNARQPDWENPPLIHRNRLPGRARFAACPDEPTALSGTGRPCEIVAQRPSFSRVRFQPLRSGTENLLKMGRQR